MQRSPTVVVLVSILATLCAAAAADGGYVFMKNGYIIQGRVVEKDGEKIVLRWTNGTMIIGQRFISELVLDASEEEDLKAIEALKQENREQVEYGGDPEHDVVLELPENLEEIIALHGDSFHGREPSTTVVEVKPLAGVGIEPTPAGAPGTVTGKAELAFPKASIALVPPEEWEVAEEGNRIRVRKPGDGPTPALTIDFQTVTGVTRETAQKEFRSLLVGTYPELGKVREWEDRVGDAPAYCIEGEYKARNVTFTEVLVHRGNVCYLIALTMPVPQFAEDREALQAALRSLRFLET